MSKHSKIEWTDHTFNPWMGCTKVGPGCDHCYAENMMDTRLSTVKWGAGSPRKRTSATNWKRPIAWNREKWFECATCRWRGDEKKLETSGGSLTDGLPSCPQCDSIYVKPTRARVFCASLADVFDNEVDPGWRHDLWALIDATPNLDWLLLTKRIGNADSMLPHQFADEPWPHVWLGATVVDQDEADRDIVKLLETPAAIRFVSMEPLLAGVDLTQLRADFTTGTYRNALNGVARGRYTNYENLNKLDWVIVGGESGNQARAMERRWAVSIQRQCEINKVPFLFKQWGEHDEDGNKVGKVVAGRYLDGNYYTEFPECLPSE